MDGIEPAMFKSYLSDRSQYCFILNGVLSDRESLTHGVPQGSIPCPLVLFLVYIMTDPDSLSFCTPGMLAYDTYMRVQHRFHGMRDGAYNRDGMRDTRNTEGGIGDENILAGSGCSHFNWWDAG